MMHKGIVKTLEAPAISPCCAAKNASQICGERDPLAQGEGRAAFTARAASSILAGSGSSHDAPERE